MRLSCKLGVDLKDPVSFIETNIDRNRFFSRRFSRKKPTIIMAFRQCFFKTTLTDQNSSTKVLQNIIAPNCTIWPSELNQKGFSCFPRNIPYRARPKGPPFQFFSALRDFFPINFFHKRVPNTLTY